MFVLGDMNINIWQNGVNLLENNANTSKGKIVISLKSYIKVCSSMELKQLIKAQE